MNENVFKYDLFVSYATPNRKIAEYVVEKIEKRGKKCFIAPRNIRLGFDYAAEIGGDTYGGQLTYNYYTGKFKSGDFNEDLSEVLPSYKRFEAALGGGVGVELFRLIEVKAGYDWGLTERSKSAEIFSSKRNIFYVTLGFRF